MKSRLAGFLVAAGMSLAANAETFHFTPITDSGNPLLQALGNQLTLNVTDGGAGNVLFTFTNDGSINSTIARVFLDAPANLFSNVAVASQSAGVTFAPNTGPGNLPAGNTVNFTATNQFGASAPPPIDGVNDSTGFPGESLTLSGTLNPGTTFADVISSLDTTGAAALRAGAHVISIAQANDESASFVNVPGTPGGGGSPPPPVPEPETYGMLLAGLGFLTVALRRRRG